MLLAEPIEVTLALARSLDEQDTGSKNGCDDSKDAHVHLCRHGAICEGECDTPRQGRSDLSELLFAEYLDLDIRYVPRLERVSTGEEGIQKLRERRFDLVLCMSHLPDMSPLVFRERAKEVTHRRVRSLKAGRPAHGIYHGVRGGHGANQGGES